MVLNEQLQELSGFQKATDARMAALAESQQRTDERLNALIAIVDDLVRKRPN